MVEAPTAPESVDALRDLLRQKMVAEGLSQLETASLSGLPQSWISRFLAGRTRTIQSRNRASLSRFLGFTPSEDAKLTVRELLLRRSSLLKEMSRIDALLAAHWVDP